MPDTASPYATIPGPAPQGPPNLLGAVGQFAGAQNMLNQNAQFQQMFRARQAIGQIMQGAIDPQTGQPNMSKAMADVATHPDTAWMAPEFINQLIQRGQTEAQTANAVLQNKHDQFMYMANGLSGLITKAQAAKSVPGTANAIDPKDVLSMVAAIGSAHGLPPKDQIDFYRHLGMNIDPKTGEPTGDFIPSLAYKNAVNLLESVIPAADRLKTTMVALGGKTQAVRESPVSGTVLPMQGGSFTQVPTAAERNEPVQTTNQVTGAVSAQPRGALGPMFTGSGQLESGAPATVGPPGLGPKPVQTTTVTPGAPQGYPTPPSPTAPNAGAPSWIKSLSPVVAKQLEGMGPQIKEINEEGTKALKANQIIDEMEKAASQFRAGGGMGAYVQVAQALQALGVKDSTVDRVAGGSLPAAQEFGKLQVQLSSAMIKQALMPGAGRITNLEFETFRKNNPNWDQDPRTLRSLFSFMKQVNGLAYQKQQAWARVYAEGSRPDGQLPRGMADLSQFEPWWNNQLVKNNVISEGTKKALGVGASP